MPLESGTYIPDLVATNPAAGDGVNQGDDHLRLVKSCVKATFPNFTSGPLNSTQAQLDNAVSVSVGTANHNLPRGSAPSPGLYPLGDSDTGFYSAGTDASASR